jgi:hypothetical protein
VTQTSSAIPSDPGRKADHFKGGGSLPHSVVLLMLAMERPQV